MVILFYGYEGNLNIALQLTVGDCNKGMSSLFSDTIFAFFRVIS